MQKYPNYSWSQSTGDADPDFHIVPEEENQLRQIHSHGRQFVSKLRGPSETYADGTVKHIEHKAYQIASSWWEPLSCVVGKACQMVFTCHTTHPLRARSPAVPCHLGCVVLSVPNTDWFEMAAQHC